MAKNLLSNSRKQIKICRISGCNGLEALKQKLKQHWPMIKLQESFLEILCG